MRTVVLTGGLVVLASAASLGLLAQRPDAFGHPLTHPAIQYPTRPTSDPIARLNADLERGAVTLTHDPANGYLLGLLAAAHVPIESQLLVFSQTSAQGEQVAQSNPRALFFSDDVSVGWVRGTDLLEVAAVDPQQGPVFYTLDQKLSDSPRFKRDDGCLLCHDIWETHGVPGLQTLSTFPMADEKAYASGTVTDHRTPFVERWGGWFVTGQSVPTYHLGNLPVVRPAPRAPTAAPVLQSVKGLFDPAGYPASTSDVVSLMVFEHQTSVTNLITWLGWETRVSESGIRDPGAGIRVPERVAFAARELVDALLFVDEAPLTRPVAGNSGFAERFAASGVKDSKGRSLRQLDLKRRLFTYRCSYMIDSAAFAALPGAARQAVYARLSDVLSGADRAPAYETLTRDDRQAIVDILRDTRTDLPATFGTAVR
jgi:hypothetical protein